jgi:hypothetical protein
VKKAAIAAVLALASVAAHADSWFQYEGAIGVNHYGTTNGRWYQDGMPDNVVNVSAPALSVGVGIHLYRAQDWGIDGHIAYVYLGRASAHCDCTSDANYNVVTHSVRNPKDGSGGFFTGSGNAQGISLTLEPYFTYAGWHIGVPFGAFPYRPQWDEQVTPFATDSQAGKMLYAHTPNGLQLGYSVGVSVSRGNFGVSFTRYELPSGSTQFPAIYNNANVLMLTYHY